MFREASSSTVTVWRHDPDIRVCSCNVEDRNTGELIHWIQYQSSPLAEKAEPYVTSNSQFTVVSLVPAAYDQLIKKIFGEEK